MYIAIISTTVHFMYSFHLIVNQLEFNENLSMRSIYDIFK